MPFALHPNETTAPSNSRHENQAEDHDGWVDPLHDPQYGNTEGKVEQYESRARESIEECDRVLPKDEQ